MTGSILATLLSATFLAAVVGAIVNTTIARKKSLEEERSRVRTTYAEAFEAVAAHQLAQLHVGVVHQQIEVVGLGDLAESAAVARTDQRGDTPPALIFRHGSVNL